jgi:hypothetical protein
MSRRVKRYKGGDMEGKVEFLVQRDRFDFIPYRRKPVSSGRQGQAFGK